MFGALGGRDSPSQEGIREIKKIVKKEKFKKRPAIANHVEYRDGRGRLGERKARLEGHKEIPKKSRKGSSW